MGKEIFHPIDVSFAQQLTKGVFHTNRIYQSTEVLYTDKQNITGKYLNKKILIIGGGPSSISYDWKLLDYDYIWTLNRFYQNKDIILEPIDLIHFGTLVPFDDPELLSYLNTSTASIYFEANHIRQHVWDYLQTSGFMTKYTDRCNFYMTRFKGVMGAANRLVLLAAFMGASDVYFVGVDGFTKQNKRYHAFWDSGDTSTKNVPGQHIEAGGDATYGYDDYREGYGHYVTYLNQIKKSIGTNFYNLGEGHESNIIGDSYRDMLPLPSKLRQL